MKHYLLNFIFLLLPLCGHAQNDDTLPEPGSYNNQKTMNMNTEIDTLEKFNIDRFEQNADEYGYFTYTDMGRNVEQRKFTEYYVETSRRPDEYFELYRIFYLNGNLKQEGWRYWKHSFPKGVWKTYDEQGHLVGSFDVDKPYENCPWEAIVEYAQRHGIDLLSSFTDVMKGYNPENNSPRWYIIWRDPERKEGDRTVITIDVLTRKIVDRQPTYFEK